MSAMPVESYCEWSDLPTWLCPHCPEFGGQPEPKPGLVRCGPPQGGHWVIRWDGRGWFSRQWQGLAEDAGKGKPLAVWCDHESENPLCPGCVKLVGSILDDVPALLFDLEMAVARDVTFVAHGVFQHDKGDDQGSPIPWNDRASKARRRLIFEIHAVASALGVLEDDCLRSALRLPAALPRLARRDDGPEYAVRLSDAVANAHRAIDQPPSPWYYGPCPKCTRDIYAERLDDKDPAATVACPHETCDYAAPLRDHRVAQLNAGENRLLTVSELVGALVSAGEPVTRHQINGWIRRDGLAQEWQNRPRMVRGRLEVGGDFVYRLGDVRAKALEAAIRR